MAKGDRLTIKQKRFAKEYVRTGNATDAAYGIYNTKSRHNAKQIAHQVLKKNIVKKEITRLLDDQGLGLDSNADNLKKVIGLGIDSGKATVDTALRGIIEVFKLHNAYPASKSIKLSYTKTEQVSSKDGDAITEDLKTITQRATTLLSSSE